MKIPTTNALLSAMKKTDPVGRGSKWLEGLKDLNTGIYIYRMKNYK